MADYRLDSAALYAQTHEWLRIEDDLAVVGISDAAQDMMSDVVFVELPEADTDIQRGDEFGTVESTKAVSELYSPVAGEVVEVNSDLNSKPKIINEDPHGEAWLIVVRITDPASVAALMDAETYKAFVESEAK